MLKPMNQSSLLAPCAIWAGVVPIVTTLGEPVDDGRILAGVPMSSALAALTGKQL